MDYQSHTMKQTLLFLCALCVFAASSPSRAQDKPTDTATRVACVGDSITYGSGIKDLDHDSYPAQLQSMLGPTYAVKNFGVSGATLLKNGDKPYWKQKGFQAAKDFAPNIVVIKLGTNDTKPPNWKHSDEFLADAKALAQEFATLPSRPKIYLCHPVPAFPGNFGIRDEVIKNEVIPLIDQAANESGATIIDLYAPLADHADLFKDKVHPNAEGAKLIAEEVHKALTAHAPAKKE